MADFFLRDFGGGRQAMKPLRCRWPGWRSFRDKPDKPAAEQGADCRYKASAPIPENQNDADFRVENGLRFSTACRAEAEKQRRGISQGGLKQLLEQFDLRFFNRDPEKEREDQAARRPAAADSSRQAQMVKINCFWIRWDIRYPLPSAVLFGTSRRTRYG